MTKDWEPLREEIRKLYMSEDKPLDEVMRLVRGRHNFIASERSYRTQLKKWGYMKYSTQAFPKPDKRAHASKRSRQRPTAALSNPEGMGIFPGEVSLTEGLPAFSTLDAGRVNFFFTTPDVPSAGVSAPQPNALSHETQTPALFHLGQNDQDGEGRTQLHRAALGGDLDQVRMLLNAGVSVETQDHLGNTPLHCGVTSQNVAIVELILKFGADIDAQNHLGLAPLHLATSRPDLVRALVNQGANSSIQDEKGDTPLHLLIPMDFRRESNDFYIAAYTLLKSGADINRGNKAGTTPFLQLLDHPYSARLSETIQIFLQAGGSVHQNLPDGRTPLQIFFSRARTTTLYWNARHMKALENDILKHFLANGASSITPLPCGRPLISAYCQGYITCWRSDITIGKEIFKRVTPDEVKKEGDSCLLELASGLHSWQRTEIGAFMRVLLRHGADPNCQSFKGKNPLIFLFQSSKGTPLVIASALSCLLEYGADPWRQDFDGACALFEAAKTFPEEKFVRMMLKADLPRQQSTHGPDLESSGATGSEVWDEWQQAARAADWNEAKQLILREPSSLGNKISKVIRDSALVVLAEKHVQLAKDKFERDDNATELRRRFVAGIFLDCRQSGVIPDAGCTNYLVDLCL